MFLVQAEDLVGWTCGTVNFLHDMIILSYRHGLILCGCRLNYRLMVPLHILIYHPMLQISHECVDMLFSLCVYNKLVIIQCGYPIIL